MHHEVVPRPCKICDWVLNLSRYHYGLHQGKNVRVTMEFEVLKRHILGPTLSTHMGLTGFAVGVVKKGALIDKGRGP